MIDCICQFGRNLPDGHKNCPYCGTDLDLLYKLRELPDSYIQKGIGMLEKERIEEGIQYLETAVSLNPDAAAAYRLLGNAYMQKNAYNEAVFHYDKAHALAPDDEDVLKARAKAEEARNKAADEQKLQAGKKTLLKRLLIFVPAAAFILGLAVLPAANAIFPAKNNGDAVMAPADIEKSFLNYASLKDIDVSVTAEGNTLKVSGVVPDVSIKGFIADLIYNEAGGRQVDLRGLSVREEGAPALAEIADRVQKGISENRLLAGMTLRVEVSGNAILISGEVPSESRAALIDEITRQTAGSDAAVVIADAGGQEAPGTYTVKTGDTLYSIAQSLYGDGNEWTRIYDANKNIIETPHELIKGVELTIPAG